MKAKKEITEVIEGMGYKVLTLDELTGIVTQYDDYSLAQIIIEDSEKILEKDPMFFQTYDIKIPDEERIRRLYGKDADFVIGKAKFVFANLALYATEEDDPDTLENMIYYFKHIYDGTYMDVY